MDTKILIIGTGFGGLGMAIRLLQSGEKNFVILEKADDIGGVWRENHYPGAACDVPSHLYAYSFERHFDWSSTFSPQEDILRYMRYCADKYGLKPYIKTSKEVLSARFDQAAGKWQVSCADGSDYQARILIAATGQLCRPAIPKLPGLDQFQGDMFHSAQWRHDIDLKGKSVAVIGTGASAIQFVPHLAQQAGKLIIFQRSPPYIFPKEDRLYNGFWGWVYRILPFMQSWHRLYVYLLLESRQPVMTGSRFMNAMVGRLFRKHFEEQVPDPVLREKLMPDYPMGCKRLLISDDYYPALGRDNVTLVTDAVASLEKDAVISTAGERYQVDCVVLGTGFDATHFLAPIQVTGIDGVTLEQTWKEGAEAYLGTTVSGFPNLFMLYGPNTNLGHNSIIYMLESQFNYVLSALQYLRDNTGSLNVKADVQQRFNQDLQEKLRSTVWLAGCHSWYVNEYGRSANNWPGSTLRFRALTRELKAADYELIPLSARQPVKHPDTVATG